MKRTRACRVVKKVAKPKPAPKKKKRAARAPAAIPMLPVVPALVIPSPEPQGPEPEHDFWHPVVRVDLRIEPGLFAKLRALSHQSRAGLNKRIVQFIATALDGEEIEL